MEAKAQALLEHYLNRLPEEERSRPRKVDAYHFCGNEECANTCARLVREGEKRATASLLWAYEAEDEPLAEVGDLAVITDWEGEPQAVIEITAVVVKPFKDVNTEDAFEEGEGDKSLVFWRRVHWDAFTPDCQEIGREPSEVMPVVLERFRLVLLA